MDKNKLIELAKAKGLDIAEDAAGQVAELALEIVGELIKESENKYDDMIWTAVEGKAREELNKIIDKIDGQEG